MLYEFYEEGRDIVTCGAVSDKFFILIDGNVQVLLLVDDVIEGDDGILYKKIIKERIK